MNPRPGGGGGWRVGSVMDDEHDVDEERRSGKVAGRENWKRIPSRFAMVIGGFRQLL